MSATFVWSINSMPAYSQIDGQSDVVFLVNWTLTGTQGDVTSTTQGEQPVSYTAGEPFTPYDQLTETQVIGWVQTGLGPEGVAAAELKVQTSIDNIINPPVVYLPLPWATPAA